MLRSRSSAVTAPLLMGLPSGPTLISKRIQQRRLLQLNISQCCFQDLCVAHPAKYSQGGEHRSVDDAHLELCHAVKGGDTTRRHRHLQDTLVVMLKSASLKPAMTDATQDQATRARLERANLVTPHRGGMTRGGNILIPHGLDTRPGPLSKLVIRSDDCLGTGSLP